MWSLWEPTGQGGHLATKLLMLDELLEKSNCQWIHMRRKMMSVFKFKWFMRGLQWKYAPTGIRMSDRIFLLGETNSSITYSTYNKAKCPLRSYLDVPFSVWPKSVSVNYEDIIDRLLTDHSSSSCNQAQQACQALNFSTCQNSARGDVVVSLLINSLGVLCYFCYRRTIQLFQI